MSESEMVDRVGLAIFSAEPDLPPDLCRRLARIAIEAMREPTGEMAKQIVLLTFHEKGWNVLAPVQVWQSMIDRALEP